MAALTLALAIASAGPAPAAVQATPVAELVRQACVETGMRRDAFEDLGRSRRWRQARPNANSTPPGGWSVAFRIDGGSVMLGYVPGTGAGDPSIGSVCSVSVDRAAPTTEAEVGALAASLGLDEEMPDANLPPGLAPMRIWSRLGDQTLTYAAAPDGRAIVSLSRQVVSTGPAPASPPGN